MSIETWLPVQGFVGDYEVSNKGGVRSLDRFRFIEPTKKRRAHYRLQKGQVLMPCMSQGYPNVTLWNKGNGQMRVVRIATLVMEAFEGPRPKGFYACHKDGVKMNSDHNNLYYGTPTQNSADKRRHNTHLQGEAIPWSKLTEDDVLFIRSKRGKCPQQALSYMFDVSQSHISRVQTGKEWAHV